MTPRYEGPLPLALAELDASALAAEVAAAKSAIDAGYWLFTRTARGKPPPAELYQRARWAAEALRRARGAR